MKSLWKASHAAWGALSCLAVALHGQEHTIPNEPQAIAAVRFNSLVMQTDEARHDFAAVQAKYAARQAQLKASSDEIELSRKQLITDDKLGEQQRAERTQVLQNKEKRFQRSMEDFQSESQADAQEVFQRVAQKVFLFIHQYSERHGYAAVIDRGADEAPFVLYAADNLDITDQVSKAYNLQVKTAIHDTEAQPDASASRRKKPASDWFADQGAHRHVPWPPGIASDR